MREQTDRIRGVWLFYWWNERIESIDRWIKVTLKQMYEKEYWVKNIRAENSASYGDQNER